mgnify:CR=1 FL=1
MLKILLSHSFIVKNNIDHKLFNRIISVTTPSIAFLARRSFLRHYMMAFRIQPHNFLTQDSSAA